MNDWCFRPWFCTVKAILGPRQPGRWTMLMDIFYNIIFQWYHVSFLLLFFFLLCGKRLPLLVLHESMASRVSKHQFILVLQISCEPSLKCYKYIVFRYQTSLLWVFFSIFFSETTLFFTFPPSLFPAPQHWVCLPEGSIWPPVYWVLNCRHYNRTTWSKDLILTGFFHLIFVISPCHQYWVASSLPPRWKRGAGLVAVKEMPKSYWSQFTGTEKIYYTVPQGTVFYGTGIVLCT